MNQQPSNRDNVVMPPSTTYTIYKEVSAPSAIDYSLSARFTSASQSNLIVVKGNVMEIFVLTPMKSGNQTNQTNQSTEPINHPMKRVGEYKLHGSISSIGVLHLEGCQRDSLMLAFEPARLAIVHFDPSTNQLITLDTAIYDQSINPENLSSMGRINRSINPPIIRVDPLNRCAAVLIGGTYMVICPLMDISIKAQSIESVDQSVKPYLYNQPGSITKPYIQPVNQFGIQSISDFQFLNGYNQPTILVLHETPYTWEGRYAVNRATKRLINLAVEMNDRSIGVIGHVTMPLPHDADTILALPSPIDGAVILSSHLIFHFYNQNIDYILSANQFGDTDQRYHAERSSIVCQLLIASACVMNAPNQSMSQSLSQSRVEILLALKDGQLLLLSVEPSGTSVRRMTLFKLAQASVLSDLTPISLFSHQSACLVDVGNFLVFMASRLGQSLLVEFRARSESEMVGEQIEADRLEDAERNEREERDRARQSIMNNELGASADQSAEAVDQPKDFLSSFAGDDLFDDLFGFTSQREDEEKRASERKEKRARARAENSRAYELIVRDAFINVAPCSDAMVWPSIDGVPDKPVNQFLHLSGVGSEGSLQFIQKGVTPNVITSFPLEQRCQGSFAVFAPDPNQPKRKRKRDRNGDEINQSAEHLDEYHRYVFISTASSTLALLTGDDVTQVDASIAHLIGDVSSLIIGNLINQSIICQVWHAGVRFVYQSDFVVNQSVNQIFDGAVSGEPVRIVSADLCDPYVAVTLSDGSMRLLTVKLTDQSINQSANQSNEPFTVEIFNPSLPSLPEADQARSAITAISLYKDRNINRLFVPSQSTNQSVDHSMSNGDEINPSTSHSVVAEPASMEVEEVDELELLLGGGSKPETDQSIKTNGADQSVSQSVNQPIKDEPVYACVVCRAHFVQIYSLPTFTLLFSAPRFAAGSSLLINRSINHSTNQSDHVIQSSSLSPIVEVCLTALTSTADPTIFAFTRTGDLLMYQSFSHQSINQSTSLRFARFSAPLTRTGTIKTGRGGPSIAPPEWMYGRRFVPFNQSINQSINGHSGLMIGGWSSHIVIGERDYPRIHEFVWSKREDRSNRRFEESVMLDSMETSSDREKRLVPGVACSIPFKNVNCQSGMIFIDISGVFHIAELAPKSPWPHFTAESASASVTLTRGETLHHAHYDSALVVRCLPLAATPRFITYHSLTCSLALCLSSPKPLLSMEEPTPRSLTLYEDSFEVLLLNALNLSVIGRFDDFDAREVVTCMTCVSIKEKEYVSVGTGVSNGEESQVRGRILLLDVFYAAADQAINQSSTRYLKLRAFAQAEKGVVSSIASLDGHVCVGVGSRVMLYEYDGKNLIGRAFLDTQSFIYSIKTLKNMLVVTDLCDSIHFAVWDPIVKQIMLFGATHERRFVSALDWMVDGTEVCIFVADHAGNCHTLRYEPKKLPPDPPLPSSVYLTATLTLPQFFATAKQQRLTVKTDFHTDSVLNKTVLFAMKSSVGPSMFSPAPLPLRSFLWSFTTNGRCCIISVCDEIWHRRLSSLASQIAAHTQPIAACNARHYRMIHANRASITPQKGILDYQLLQQYLHMDVDMQLRLARMIGLQPDQIIEYLGIQEWQTQM